MQQRSPSRALRREAREAPETGIVEVFNYGRGRRGPDPALGRRGRPADARLHRRGGDALARGGRDLLHLAARHPRAARGARRATTSGIYGRAFAAERFFVTGGGMQAIQIAASHASPAHGDEVIVPTPAWPNFAAAIGIAGATPVAVPLDFGNAGWTLDLDRLFAAVDAAHARASSSTRRPTRPAGRRAATSSRAILDFARERGLWIIADEVYQPLRLSRGAARAVLPRRRRARTTASSSSTPSPRTGR